VRAGARNVAQKRGGVSVPGLVSARAKKTGEDSTASDAVPEPEAATNAAGRARRTSWIIQSLRSRFGGMYL